MSHTDLCWLPATDMASAIRARQLSPVELVDALLSRIHQLNPAINAYCTLTEEAARHAARAAEAAVLRGDDLGLLHGVPMSIKDLLFTSGVRTMRGSRIYEQFVPDQDAPAVAKLKASGAILLGKTTTPEFGWKGVTDSPVTGVSRNPWNLARSCGGSSGGAPLRLPPAWGRWRLARMAPARSASQRPFVVSSALSRRAVGWPSIPQVQSAFCRTPGR